MSRDALYKDRRLVAIYDAVNRGQADFEFYISHLPDPPCSVLDIGCGTGTFALGLAARGYQVTGVDPASQMLCRASEKDLSQSVNWVAGSVADLDRKARFDIAFMTGHAFQCLIEDCQISHLFKAVEARLCHDGSFWFETRNPAVKPWLYWTPAQARPAIELGNGQNVLVTHSVLDVSGDRVTFEERYAFNDGAETLASQSTLRFLDIDQINALAEPQNLVVAETFGNWNHDPLAPDSPEIIVHLRKRV